MDPGIYSDLGWNSKIRGYLPYEVGSSSNIIIALHANVLKTLLLVFIN